MLPSDKQTELIVLRESVRARTSVTPVSVLVTFVSIFMYIPFMLGLGVTQGRVILWAAPLTLLMLGRGFLSRWINKRLDEYSGQELTRADWMLRISSILNQMTVGMGIWIVQSPSASSLVLSLFMTLIVAIWSIGLLSNLFSDFRSFIMSMPFLIGETSIFWLLQGDIGVSIGLSLLFAALLMVFLVRRGTEIFRDSVLMRFEKDRLLEEVEVARQNILQALQKAQAANESKAYFMAAASHDIKQPLHALAILTDTMLMSDLPESTLGLLQKQRESVGFMSAHFDALMDIGRFELGHFELRPARVRLGELSVRIDAEIAPLCAHKTLRWNLDMDDVLVSTDAELLLRLLRNLLSNAVQYTESGEVCCHAKSQGDSVEFLISDTGPGIAAEHHEVIFEQFVRLGSDGAGSTGVGLGLSIVEKINQSLDLGLKMSSVPGKGTQFRFRLSIVSGE